MVEVVESVPVDVVVVVEVVEAVVLVDVVEECICAVSARKWVVVTVVWLVLCFGGVWILRFRFWVDIVFWICCQVCKWADFALTLWEVLRSCRCEF